MGSLGHYRSCECGNTDNKSARGASDSEIDSQGWVWCRKCGGRRLGVDSGDSEPKKCGGDGRNNNRRLSEVVYRDYDPVEDKISLHILLREYWLELFGDDIDEFIWLGEDRPYRINRIEAELLKWTLEDKASVRVAEVNDKLIGFMVYHYFFESCLIVRGIYFAPEFRKRSLLARMIFSVGHVSRVLSQTLSKHGPKEIIGEKKNRHMIYQNDEFMVWENVVSPGNRRNNGRNSKKDDQRT